MKLNDQQIQKIISELPHNVRKAVVTFDWGSRILEIGQEHGLHMNQINDFRYETLMIILGMSPSTNYQSQLVKELGIKKHLATSLVESANIHIFHELQKRAFSSDGDEVSSEPNEIAGGDPYLEPIDHDDLRGPMAEEGVHLVDEYTRPQTDLQREFDNLNNLETKTSDDITNTTTLPEDTNPTQKQPSISETSYQEPIDASDLRGVDGHRTNTQVLKTQHHVQPDQAFTNTKTIQNNDVIENSYITPSYSGRDLGQGLNQSLDKHIMNNPFIAKGDNLDVSPSEQEQIKESGNFLKTLRNTDN